MWQRLPVWFRAVVLGLVVSGVPTTIWAILATVNVRLTPSVPWSVAVMAFVLWLYWRVVSRQKDDLRAAPLPTDTWRLTLLAGGSGIASLWALFAALRGVLHIAQPPNDLSKIPIATVFAALAMGSAVAGITEEAGFRGFMQRALERAYGPVAAIAVTSVIFTLVHLSHGAAVLPFLPFYFVAAVVYGLMARLSGSIVPGMILHAGGDFLTFTLRFIAAKQGAAGGATGIAPVYFIVALGLASLSVLLFRQLARTESVGAHAFSS